MSETEDDDADSWSASSGGAAVAKQQLSRAEFRGRARQMLRRYADENALGQLRGYHQAFIERAERYSAIQRFWMVANMRRHERESTGVADPFCERELLRIEAWTTSPHWNG